MLEAAILRSVANGRNVERAADRPGELEGAVYIGRGVDRAIDHRSELNLQLVNAAGKGDGVGARCAVTAHAAGNRAGVDDGDICTDDASTASAVGYNVSYSRRSSIAAGDGSRVGERTAILHDHAPTARSAASTVESRPGERRSTGAAVAASDGFADVEAIGAISQYGAITTAATTATGAVASATAAPSASTGAAVTAQPTPECPASA